jgi:hypothetical protein
MLACFGATCTILRSLERCPVKADRSENVPRLGYFFDHLKQMASLFNEKASEQEASFFVVFRGRLQSIQLLPNTLSVQVLYLLLHYQAGPKPPLPVISY